MPQKLRHTSDTFDVPLPLSRIACATQATFIDGVIELALIEAIRLSQLEAISEESKSG
jgi:hypothetical protein